VINSDTKRRWVDVKRWISLAAALVAAAACTAIVTAGSSAQSSGLPQLTLGMNGSSINVGGALQSGAVDVVSTTTNERQANPTLVRLNPGVTPEQLLAFVNSPASRQTDNVSRFGSIVFSAEADKGVSHVQTTLQPGTYVAIDTTGDNPAKFPHTSFTISQASQPATLPTPKETIKGIDFGFRGPRTLHDGDPVRFENDGFVVHMIVATHARNKAAAAQIVKLLKAGKDRKVPKLAVGGATFQNPVSTGAVQQITVNAKPGYWVLECFMDTQDGREHTQLGMERIEHIVR
jgi:hypothetical protein